jgi:hypothetical protein
VHAPHVDQPVTSQSFGIGDGAGVGGDGVGTGCGAKVGLQMGLGCTMTFRQRAMSLPDLSTQKYLIAHVPVTSKLSDETGARTPPWHEASLPSSLPTHTYSPSQSSA